jgi:myosin heavy subunit
MTTATERNSLMSLTSLQRGSPSSSSEDEASTHLSIARNHSLLDDMEDSPMPSASPGKRRRTSPYTTDNGWQGFCRKGTQIKALLDDAFVKVVSASATVERQGSRDSESPGSEMEAVDMSMSIAPSSSSFSVANIARQKTAECILLQQELEKVKMEHTQLQALNHELRESARHQSTRMQKMTSALQLASQNSAKARVDADAAEATAATLAMQLQALQMVIHETKRASHILLKEQDEITQKAQSVEQKYVQTQADLARANTQRQTLQRQTLKLTQTTKSLEDNIRELKTRLDHQRAETKQWQQSCAELQDLEDSQQQRKRRIEEELQQAQTLLVDATATAAETEATTTQLKNSMEKLQQANQQLHKQLEEQQSKVRNEKENHRDALQVAHTENQAFKNKDLSQQDQIKKLTAENQAQERRFSQIQTKTTNLERRLQEATNLVDTTNSIENSSPFSIPTLGKENTSMPTCKCMICFKDAVGLMKKCQCGKPGCTSRAHATCVNKITAGPSVSHPGTPAPRLPVVLCGGSRAAAITPIATGTRGG